MAFLTKNNNKTPLGIYVHVPFCRSKCRLNAKKIEKFFKNLLIITVKRGIIYLALNDREC